MNLLFFDTETTGLARFDLPASSDKQPRIIQLGCVLVDSEFNEKAVFKTLIKPDGWYIHPGAEKAHGITIEQCAKHGIHIDAALSVFDGLAAKADYVVAHNIKFDAFMIDIEQSMQLDPFRYDWKTQGICTMLGMTNICKLPSSKGFKWPKLQEAYEHCFGSKFDGAHDALADVRACISVFRWMHDNNHIASLLNDTEAMKLNS